MFFDFWKKQHFFLEVILLQLLKFFSVDAKLKENSFAHWILASDVLEISVVTNFGQFPARRLVLVVARFCAEMLLFYSAAIVRLIVMAESFSSPPSKIILPISFSAKCTECDGGDP